MTSSIALKALIVLTSHAELGETGKKTGWYLPEASHPYYALASAGIEVDFVSPRGGKAPMDESSRDLTDPDNARFLGDTKLMARVDSTLRPTEVDPTRYGAILFAGGHGTMWDFANDAALGRLAASIYEKGGVVAAVCHGPAALVNLRLSDGKYLVAGKQIATFTNAEEEEAGLTRVMPFLLETKLRERGAHIQSAPNWSEKVVVDGRLVTGQNPASAKGVANEVVRLLKQK